jgi:hypothetical protein
MAEINSAILPTQFLIFPPANQFAPPKSGGVGQYPSNPMNRVERTMLLSEAIYANPVSAHFRLRINSQARDFKPDKSG